MERRRMLQLGGVVFGTGAAGALPVPVDTSVSRLIQAASATALAPGTLAALDQTADHYAASYFEYAPADLDGGLFAVLAEIRGYLEGQTTGAQRIRLCGIGARLAVMLGFTRWGLGRVDDAGLYYGAAFELADQAGDRPFTGWILSHEGMVAYHAGRYDDAAELIDAGRRMLGRRSAFATDLAAEHGRAAARAGDASAARSATTDARRRVERGDLDLSESVFALSAPAVLHLVADAELWLGDNETARTSAREAISASTTRRDQLVSLPSARMTLAVAEVRLGNLDVGIGEATGALRASHDGPTMPAMRARGLDLLGELSNVPGAASSPLVRDYRELVASLTPATA